MVPKTAPTLYSIFNRNDPTPTAQAMRNVEWGFAKVLVIGRGRFERRHEENLRRLVAWTTGTAQYYQEGDEWPDDLWKSDWTWPPLAINKLKFEFLDEIEPMQISGIESGDIVDLTSGTKEQAGSLIRAVHHLGVDVDFVLQTRSGETLNLSTGEAVEGLHGLTFRERVWLSSGYIVDYHIAGDPAAGKIWSECSKSGKGGKIMPERGIAKKLGKKINWGQGYWLESASAHLMSTWPNISESFAGPRLIRPSFTRAAGTASYLIKRERWKREAFESVLGAFAAFESSIKNLDPEVDIDLHSLRGDAWTKVLRDTKLTQNQKNAVVKSMHSVEFDFIAFDNEEGTVFVGECKAFKDPNKIDEGAYDRIHSISKMVFPTNGVPLLTYTGKESKLESGVRVISWPELSDPSVLGGPPGASPEEMGVISMEHSGPQMDLATPLQEPGQEPVEEKSAERRRRKDLRKSIQNLDPTEEFDEIREALLICREEPRTYYQTSQLLKKRGVRMRRLLKKMERAASELGFSVNTIEDVGKPRRPIGGTGWLSWDEEE